MSIASTASDTAGARRTSTVSTAVACDRLPPMEDQQRQRDLAALGLLDEPVRRQLYDWVVAQAGPVGREAAARAVGVSRALATFHLDKLAVAGLLDASYLRLTGRVGPGAGRPARVYRRADRELSVSLPERRYAPSGRPLRDRARASRRWPSATSTDARRPRARVGAGPGSAAGLTADPAAEGPRRGRLRAEHRARRRHPAAQLPVRRAGGRAPHARVRHERRDGRRHRRGRRRRRARPGPRCSAGLLLRHVPRATCLTALTWPAVRGHGRKDAARSVRRPPSSRGLPPRRRRHGSRRGS